MKNQYLFFIIFLFAAINCAAQNINFTYMGAYSNLGVPGYAEPNNDKIDTTLISDINKFLPEKKTVPALHPEYISKNAETDVLLYKTAEVWVTFVNEGAVYTDAMGFYTYDIKNPPKSSSEIANHTIIFPNTSLINSGGGLNTGKKVRIGKFPPNTGIGWFIVSNGWQNGILNPKSPIFYSESTLNPESVESLKSHMVLLNDKTRNLYLMGFEDLRRDQNSDHDFNDVIFYITVGPNDAVKNDNVVVVNDPQKENKPENDDTKNGGKNNGKGGKGNHGKGNGDVIIIINNNGNNNSTNVGNNNNSSSNGSTNSNNTSGGSGTSGSSSNNNDGSNGNGGSNNTDDGGPLPVCYQQGIRASEFEKVKKSITAQYVEETKKTVVKQAVKSKRVTASQVKSILKLLKVESYRLEMAKFLFEFTCDKSNYYLVNDALQASSTRDLDKYLENKNYEDDNNQNSYPSQANTSPVNTNTGTVNSYNSCKNNPISSDDFSDLIQSISSKSFSDDKTTLMKQGTENRCLSVNQVRDIIRLFSFEKDKLNAAKYLYDFTGDKQNYYKINDMFSFSSTITELNDYLKSKK